MKNIFDSEEDTQRFTDELAEMIISDVVKKGLLENPDLAGELVQRFVDDLKYSLEKSISTESIVKKICREKGLVAPVFYGRI